MLVMFLGVCIGMFGLITVDNEWCIVGIVIMVVGSLIELIF